MKPGTVYTFRLGGGFHGACRILRTARKSDPPWATEMTLVCATRWIAKDPEQALSSPRAKQVLRGRVYWMKGAPPKSFKLLGVVRVPAYTKPCHESAPWGIFPNVVRGDWQDGKRLVVTVLSRTPRTKRRAADPRSSIRR